MTTQDIVNYYADLLILQYKQKPNAYATIQALAAIPVMSQLPTSVQNAFNVNTSVGAQLDILGQYVGISRTGNSFTGPVTLGDTDYRSLLKIKILQNNSGSSLYNIETLIVGFFGSAIAVFDTQDMRLSYFLNSSIGSLQLAQIIVTAGLLPKPMGVQLASVIYAANITGFFGYRSYDAAAVGRSPFNTYDVYNMSSPWLNYDNALVVS